MPYTQQLGSIEKYFDKMAASYAALLWQKEASDIPSKFELLMFS